MSDAAQVMEKSQGGRPTKLDEAVAEKIIQALRQGAFRKVAAVWAGISPRTFRDWMTAGLARPDSPHGRFRRQVLQTEAAAEIAVGAMVYRAALTDPNLGLRYLAVRWRKRWGTNRFEITGKGGRPLIPQKDEDDALLAKLEKMAAATRGEEQGQVGAGREHPSPPDEPGGEGPGRSAPG